MSGGCVREGGSLVYAVALRLLYGSLDCWTDTPPRCCRLCCTFSLRRGWWCQSSLGIAKVITFNMKRTAAQPQERGYGMSVCVPLSLLVCTCPHKNKCRHFSYFLRLAMDAVECRGEKGGRVWYTMRVDSTSCDH